MIRRVAFAMLASSAGIAHAATGTANVPSGLAFLQAAGTPNAEYVDSFVILPSDGLRATGSGSLSNGGTTASGALDARFGNAAASARTVADVQPGDTLVGDRRDPTQPSSSYSIPQALVRSFADDFIAIDAVATGPLFAAFSIDLTGTLDAATTTGTAQVRGEFSLYGIYDSGNVFAQFERATTVVASDGMTTYETRTADGSSSGDAFAGSFTGTLMFTGAGAFNPFTFALLCQSALFNVGPADSASAGCDGIGYRWGGISAVRDSQGNLIADWTALSSSGFDYRLADPGAQALTPRSVEVTPFPLPGTGVVPEPASWALMIGGFGLVGGAMRRRGGLAPVAA